jgi:Zn-dependent protease
MLEPGETAWDLRWRMFGIPVRVHPMFWLVTLLMGSSALKQGLGYVFLWVACVFVSILVHELGHVVAGLAFGAPGRIVLYGMGGLAIGSNQLAGRWRRMAVSFAGPLAGFLFLGVLLAGLWARNPASFPFYMAVVKMNLGIPVSAEDFADLRGDPAALPGRLEFAAVHDLIFINLLWGLVNLLPVWPLDGGQISRDALDGLLPGRGVGLSLGVSLVTAGLLALHCAMAANGRPLLPVRFGSFYSALFFGFLAMQSFQMLQQLQAQRRWPDDPYDRDSW